MVSHNSSHESVATAGMKHTKISQHTGSTITEEKQEI